MKKTLIYQSSEQGCGMACLRMMMCAVSGEKNYAYVPCPSKKEALSLKELGEVASQSGFSLSCMKVTDKHEILSNDAWPIMAICGKHAVVVYGKKDETLLIADPDKGMIRMKYAEFKYKWNGMYATIKKANDAPCPYRAPKFAPLRDTVILSVLQGVSILALLAGLFFVRREGGFLVPLLMFACFAILEIARRSYSVYAMKSFDSKWLPSVIRRDGHLKERWIAYHEYQKQAFASPLDLVGSLLGAFFILALVGMNEPYFFLAAGISLLGLGISRAISDKAIIKKKKKAEEIEAHLFKEEKGPDAYLLKKECYDIGSIVSYGEIFLTLLALIASLIPTFRLPEASLNGYLVYAASLLAFLSLAKRAFRYLDEAPERERGRGYFMDFIMLKHDDDVIE